MDRGPQPHPRAPEEVVTSPPVVHPEAISEIEETAVWYEARRPGLGLEFVGAVDHAFGALTERPEQAPVWKGGRPWRRHRLSRFPDSMGIGFSSSLWLIPSVGLATGLPASCPKRDGTSLQTQCTLALRRDRGSISWWGRRATRGARFMCCLCAVPLRNRSVQGGTKRHKREGDLNGLADLADNPPHSLGFFQASREFKSLFPLIQASITPRLFFCSVVLDPPFAAPVNNLSITRCPLRYAGGTGACELAQRHRHPNQVARVVCGASSSDVF